MNRRLPALLTLSSALLLSSCGGAVRPSKYYALDIPEMPPASGGPFKVVLLVGRINAPQLYRDDRIVYRTGPSQLGAYEYHRWAQPPAEMLESLLLHMLRSSGKFTSVQELASNAQGDFILRGRLHNFEEVSSPSLGARVVLELELYERSSGNVVWSHFYSHDEPVAASGKKVEVPAVVEALNHNVRRGLDEALVSLDAWFAAHPKK